jgi:hypothetical protein
VWLTRTWRRVMLEAMGEEEFGELSGDAAVSVVAEEVV